MSLRLCIIIFGIVGCLGQSTLNICLNHQNNDRIQDYSDCSKYFECVNGQPISKSCERGNKFDPILRVCSPDQFECFSCPSDTFFIDIPVDYECSQFVRCIDGVASHHVCGTELLFDPIQKQCNTKKEVVCPCPKVDFRGFPLFVRDWSDCSKYNLCANGTVAIAETCPKGLTFDLSKKQCDKMQNNYNYNNYNTGQGCGDRSTNYVFLEIPDIGDYSRMIIAHHTVGLAITFPCPYDL